MAFQPVPSVAQFNIRATLLGEVVENVLHYIDVVNPIWSAAQLATWAEIIGTEWVSGVLPWLAAQYELIEVEARDLSIEGGFTGTWSPPEPAVGEQTSPSMPGNVAFCLTKRSGRAGRSYRGRIYICGFGEGQVDGNQLQVATAEGLQAAVESIIVRSTSSTIGGVIVSRQNAGVVRPAGVATVVTSVNYFDRVVDSQRRRLPGR